MVLAAEMGDRPLPAPLPRLPPPLGVTAGLSFLHVVGVALDAGAVHHPASLASVVAARAAAAHGIDYLLRGETLPPEVSDELRPAFAVGKSLRPP